MIHRSPIGSSRFSLFSFVFEKESAASNPAMSFRGAYKDLTMNDPNSLNVARPPSANKLQKYFSMPQVADKCREMGIGNVSPWIVRTWIASGRLPYLKIGRAYFVSVDALEIFLAKLERRSR